MAIDVKMATMIELDAIQQLAIETIDKTYRPFLGDEGVDWFVSGPSNDYLKENLNNCLVISNDDKVVGFVVISENEIDLMMIDISVHGEGYGSRLLTVCEEELFKQYEEIRFVSFERNESANSFFLNSGWSYAGSLDDEISGGHKYVFTKRRD